MLYARESELLTREQLHEIQNPDRTGKVGGRWVPVQHGDLADAIVARAENMGLKVQKEVWKTNPTGTDLFGSLDLDTSDWMLCDVGQDATFSLGVRHSNVGRYAITFAIGARVAVCENGMFTGDFTLSRKHTAGVELDAMVDGGLERYLAEVGTVNHLAKDLRETEISDEVAAHKLLEAGRAQVIPWAKVGEAYNEWVDPTFSEFKGRNAWSLYNDFTYVIRDLSGANQMRSLKMVRDLFLEAA